MFLLSFSGEAFDNMSNSHYSIINLDKRTYIDINCDLYNHGKFVKSGEYDHKELDYDSLYEGYSLTSHLKYYKFVEIYNNIEEVLPANQFDIQIINKLLGI